MIWKEPPDQVFNNAVARPSTVLKANYSEACTPSSSMLTTVLNGEESAKDLVAEIERTAKRFLPGKSNPAREQLPASAHSPRKAWRTSSREMPK